MYFFYVHCGGAGTQAYALLLVEEEDRKSKEVELGGRAEQLELMCRKNAYLQDKVRGSMATGGCTQDDFSRGGESIRERGKRMYRTYLYTLLREHRKYCT